MSVRTEPLFLQTIITNLIENAIKYNKENGKVIVSACAIEGGCEVHVVDTGIGISRDEIGKVFNRFYRVDKSRSRKSGGSGLGLSIVKTLLNRLGGRISIQSQLDKGTEAVFFIPNYQENIETSYDEKEKNEEV